MNYQISPSRENAMDYKVAAHQPNFFPHLGYFHKMMESDLFVIRDEVLFSKRGFHNRNKIRISGKENPESGWIAIPVKNTNDYLKNVLIKKDAKRGKRHWRDQMIYDIESNYGDAPYFDTYFPELKRIIQTPTDSLVEFNMNIIKFLAKSFDIYTPIIMASSLKLKPEKYEKSNPSKDLADICREMGATVYLSGQGGRDYLESKFFEEEGIDIEFQEFFHPIYPQNDAGFIENMSAIDALFCFGKYPYIQNVHTKHPHIKTAFNQ